MTKPSFFRMACGEPFRLFFPLALFVGISGVILWPLYFTGVHAFYPGVMHARFMVEGFMGGFVFGFLGTAGPRLTGTPPLSPREFRLVLGLYLAAFLGHVAERPWLGDTLFLILLAVFATLLGRRFLTSANRPPPGFVLVGVGFLCAFLGTLGVLAGETGLAAPWPWLPVLGGVLLNEIWILFLILGVGSFLFPRILQISPARPGPGKPPGWNRRAALALASGAAILSLCVLDAFVDAPRLTALGRFLIAATYFISQIGALRGQAPRVTITRCLYLGMALVLLGLLFPAAWPLQRVAGLHVVFVGGFGMITITVATRVVLGHCGFGALFGKTLPALGGAALLFVAGMALRVGGDFVLPWRGGTLTLAALLWMAGALLWGWSVLPKVRFPDPD